MGLKSKIHLREKSRHGDKRNWANTKTVCETWSNTSTDTNTDTDTNTNTNTTNTITDTNTNKDTNTNAVKQELEKTCDHKTGEGEQGAGHDQRKAHPNLSSIDILIYFVFCNFDLSGYISRSINIKKYEILN